MLRLYVAAYLVSAPASVMAGLVKAAQAGRRYGAASWPVGEILPKRARCGPGMTAGSVRGPPMIPRRGGVGGGVRQGDEGQHVVGDAAVGCGTAAAGAAVRPRRVWCGGTRRLRRWPGA